MRSLAVMLAIALLAGCAFEADDGSGGDPPAAVTQAVSPVPELWGFSPLEGAWGDTIQVSGADLNILVPGVHWICFEGTPIAGQYHVLSNRLIEVRVPNGAVRGKIRLSLLSACNFPVTLSQTTGEFKIIDPALVAPGNVQAGALGDNAMAVTWQDTNNGEAGYILWVHDASLTNDEWKRYRVTTGPDVTSAYVFVLPNGNTFVNGDWYEFRVTAFTARGESRDSGRAPAQISRPLVLMGHMPMPLAPVTDTATFAFKDNKNPLVVDGAHTTGTPNGVVPEFPAYNNPVPATPNAFDIDLGNRYAANPISRLQANFAVTTFTRDAAGAPRFVTFHALLDGNNRPTPITLSTGPFVTGMNKNDFIFHGLEVTILHWDVTNGTPVVVHGDVLAHLSDPNANPMDVEYVFDVALEDR